jgi:hypothetical protein
MFSRKTIANDRASTDRHPVSKIELGNVFLREHNKASNLSPTHAGVGWSSTQVQTCSSKSGIPKARLKSQWEKMYLARLVEKYRGLALS